MARTPSPTKDAALAVMCIVGGPGQRCSLNQIAEVTGFSKGRLSTIEANAIMKLRRAIFAAIRVERARSRVLPLPVGKVRQGSTIKTLLSA